MLLNFLQRRVVLLLPLLLYPPIGCGDGRTSNRDGRLDVVATVGMVGDVVRVIAGERVAVTTLVSEGVDPHLYKPTSGDVRRLSEADVVFYVGLMLEGRMADTLQRLSQTRPAFAVTDVFNPDDLTTEEGGSGATDPHVWMDVSRWSRTADYVAERLSELDPDHAAGYRERAAAYRAELLRLDGYVRGAIASVPEDQRLLVTAHDAFGYFGRRYGIEVVGVQGLSTVSEAGLRDIERLVNLLVERRVPAVFVETSVSERNVRALVEGAAARGHAVSVGGELFSDAMGAAGTYEGTYVGMIDHNATTIARALGGQASGFRSFGPAVGAGTPEGVR